jgi:hypothetical protein
MVEKAERSAAGAAAKNAVFLTAARRTRRKNLALSVEN